MRIFPSPKGSRKYTRGRLKDNDYGALANSVSPPTLFNSPWCQVWASAHDKIDSKSLHLCCVLKFGVGGFQLRTQLKVIRLTSLVHIRLIRSISRQ